MLVDTSIWVKHLRHGQLVRLQHFDNRPHVEGFKLNFSWQGTLYFFSPPLLISFACFSRASSVRGGSPAFSIDLNTA